MNEEERKAIERCKQIIKDNNEIIKEARKNRDINSMQLTASLDNDSIAIETVLNLLEKKDKIIDEMATYIATLDIEEDICEKTKNEHCDKMNFGECEDCIKQYFENKAKEK